MKGAMAKNTKESPKEHQEYQAMLPVVGALMAVEISFE